MMERLTNKREADQQRKNYEKRLEQGYPRNIPEERFLKLAYYEDMEEQGRLVVLPCKVGDRVWAVNIAKQEIIEDIVEDFDIWTMKNGVNLRIALKNNNSYVVGKYGETVFSNEKEAEQALAFYCEGIKKVFSEDHSFPYSIFNLGLLFDGESEEAENALKGGAN